MSIDRQGISEEPITSKTQLADHLRSGEKPPDQWRVGTEHEKIGLYRDTLQPVPFDGERGIERLLEAIAKRDDWHRTTEHGRLVALEKDGASITLEPGGQLELSGAPLRAIHDTCREFNRHLELVRSVSEPFDIVWLSVGIHPLHGLADVPRMPRERHEIMRNYLPRHGHLALDMMHLTATVQANFDFADEADMVEKMRVATGVSPIVSAIFANSGLAEGKVSGYISRRLHIWEHTDPDRCGILPFVFDDDFGYARYVEWALDVPMFFLVRDGRYLPFDDMPFRRFLEEGYQGHRASLADFERHLTTLFPDVRLKRWLEVRGADAVPPALICALPALWKGILYDADARAAAATLTAGWSIDERRAALQAVAQAGLAADLRGRPALDAARELLGIAQEGLRRIAHAGVIDEDERGFLDAIAELLEGGKSPGRLIIEHWEGDWSRSVQRLIEYARY